MGTSKEDTLQISDFRGISRYLASPLNPPNKFYTIENLYSPNRGELRPLGGTVSASGLFNGALKYGSLFYGAYLNGETLIYSGYPTPTVLGAPIIGSFSFATVGVAGSSVNYKISYSGVGAESALSASASIAFGATGVDVTIPAGISDSVCAINFYVENTNTGYSWVATCCRPMTGSVATSFPSTYRIFTKQVAEENTVTPKDDPSTITFTPTTGGSLVAGKTYFFAFAPYVRRYTGTTYDYFPKVSQLIGGQYLSYTLPQGYTAVTVKANLSGLYDGANAYANSVMFMGTSYEDLLCVPLDSQSSDYQPISVGSISGAGFSVKSVAMNQNLGFITRALTTADSTNAEFRRAYFILSHQEVTGGLSCIATSTPIDYITGTGVRNILPVRGETLTTIGGPYNLVAGTATYIPFSQTHGTNTYDKLQTGVLEDRLFMANGYQQPTYTNGYLIKPIYPDYHTAEPPITTGLTVFQNRLILTGGATNPYNTEGLVYHTAVTSAGSPNIFAFTQTASASPVRDSFSIRSSDGGSFRGFGICSVNEVTIGPKAQLVIGQENSCWMTNDVTDGAREVIKGTGFASLNCFVNTNVGSFFVGRDNLYFMTPEGQAYPRGNPVASILKRLDVSKFSNTRVLFHEGLIKILYSDISDPSASTDQELWCDVQLDPDNDQPRMAWYGPHNKDTSVCQVIARSFGGFNDARIALGVLQMFRLDDADTTSRVGQGVSRSIVTNDLNLSKDHYMKLLTRLYISARASATHTLNLLVTCTDEAATGAVETFPLTVSSSIDQYKLFQHFFATRVRGRIVRVEVSFTSGASEETINIYDMSLLFKTQRRRLL